MKILEKMLTPTAFKRFMFFFSFDVLTIIFSLYFAFQLRFDFNPDAGYMTLFYNALPVFLVVKLTVFCGFRLCRITWKYVGLRDLINITAALIISEFVLVMVIYTAFTPGFPRSIFFIDGALSLILVLLVRVSKRLYIEVFYKNGGASRKGERTVIIGAGNAGEMILRDMSRHGFAGFRPVCLLDDDTNKIGTYIHGVKVFGNIAGLKDAVRQLGAQAVIIAIPSLDQKTLRSIFNSASEIGLTTIKIIPRMYDLSHPEVKLKNLETIKVEDLLGRQTVEVDYDGIKGFLSGKSVMVTGAGGSIGSEITVQACSCSPAHLVLLDIDETELHNLEIRLKNSFPELMSKQGTKDAKVTFVVADVRDKERVESVFRTHSPRIVFHAAAYKHVPMMEYNPNEAVKVNMFGTYNIADAAAANGVDKFVMISTDKAVRPTSIMGGTKRMAENICRAFNDCSSTEFISVRFGNVLGSRGSVLPLFLEQLSRGGPLTVTHKDMKRYFMTIPEAVSLVLQSSVIGKGGEVLVLDMGDPMKIVDLAEELIRIHGFTPHIDIDIEFTGSRPGEKLFEEILTAEEGTTASVHRKIFIAKNRDTYTLEQIDMILSEFETRTIDSRVWDPGRTKDLMRKYVSYFDEAGEDAAAQVPSTGLVTRVQAFEA